MRRELGLAIGGELKRARDRDRFSQDEGAERLGITREHYNRLERGTKLPSLELLVKIHRSFDIAFEILGGRSLPMVAERPPGLEASPEVRRLVNLTRSMPATQVRLLIRLALNLKKK